MRRAFRFLLVMILAVSGVWGCGPSPQSADAPQPTEFADTIFSGGPILTIVPMAQAEALAIRNGRIERVGSLDAVMPLRGPTTRMVDLAGQTLMPGFVEPHTHIDVTASGNMTIDVGSEELGNTVANVKSLLTQALPGVPTGGWLQASYFDPSRNSPQWATLTKADLDDVSTDVPIFVLNDSGHIAYVNQKAFDLAGITKDTPNPPGGTYAKDPNTGELTGQLLEPPSYTAFFAKIPPPTAAELAQQFEIVLRTFSAQGVTTIGDLNTGLAFGLDPEIAILKKLAPTSPLRIRSYLAFLAMPEPPAPGLLPELPVSLNEGDDKLKFIGIKFTTDGSTQGYTGALLQPYVTSAGGSGSGTLDFPDTQALIADAKPFFDAGWQLSMHSNGDRAIDQMLEVYSTLLADTPDPASRRLRVEHFTVTEERQIDALKQFGITPSMTIGHTFYWGDVFLGILGPARAERIDPAASILARGLPFSFHSDCPVTSVDPRRYMQEAVLRTTQGTGTILGQDQRISVDDALRAVTIHAAYQVFMDDKVGSLEPGKYADLLILGGNPRTVPATQLATLPIREVYLAGVRQFP